MKSLRELAEEFKLQNETLKQNFEANGRAMLRPLFHSLFDAAPTVEAIRWEQYTPHFNDGDACIFNMWDLQVRERVESDAPGLMSDEDLEEGFVYYHELPKGDLHTLLQEMNDSLSKAENILLAVFGDHKQVTVRRENGVLQINVEEFHHD